jgi:hypothetical protein
MPKSLVKTFNLPINGNPERTDAHFFVSVPQSYLVVSEDMHSPPRTRHLELHARGLCEDHRQRPEETNNGVGQRMVSSQPTTEPFEHTRLRLRPNYLAAGRRGGNATDFFHGHLVIKKDPGTAAQTDAATKQGARVGADLKTKRTAVLGKEVKFENVGPARPRADKRLPLRDGCRKQRRAEGRRLQAGRRKR